MGKTTHSIDEKARLVLEVLRGERTISEIASENNIHPTQLSKWKTQAIEGMPNLFENENSKIRKQQRDHDEEVDRQLKQIGKLSMQVEWLKKKSGIGNMPQ